MAGIPQVITEDRASGAQFIEGSLKFDSSKGQYLKRRPTVDGNRKLWTWSGWLKRTPGALHDIFSAGQEVTNDGLYSRFRIDSDDYLNYRQWVNTSSLDAYLVSSMKLRDPSAYFHYVAIYDSNNSTNSDKVRFYINGQRVTVFSSNDYPGGTNSSWVNSSSKTHTIGGHYDGGSSADSFWNGHMSQVYFLDGIAAGPEEFGYTDPLTNTWRPKKYTGAFTKSSPNNGTNWTQSLSAGVGSLSNGANAFDGNLSTRAQTANAAPGKELTFSPPAINFTTSLEVYCDQGSNVPTATWNGNTVNPGGGAWVTVYSGSGELSATYPLVINTESAAQYATLKGVRIDGEILIDNLNDSGANSFYLPMDGNTPIGKDQSGNGNDWTPIGFGGSVDLPKATGALPILNTNEAGTVAKRGVRTDSKTYTVTASGGNYYLDGALKPTLNFLRGGTYIFDYTGATSHPFKFSTTADGTHGGGSEYTDGTNTATSNVMKITVPHNAPDTLYYYCSAHSGMGSSINVTTDIRKADPYAWKCVLALPLLGSKDDVSASINVNSTTKTTAITGNAEARSDRWDLYSGAFYFDSTADYVQVTPTAGTTLADNTAPYTIEFFFSMNNGRFTDNTYNLMWSTSSGLSIAKWRSGISNKVYFESEGNQTGWGIQTQENINPIRWYHFAAVRNGNTITTYLDGVRQGTATSTYSASAETWWRVGGQNADGSCHAGYIQDFRIYNGVAKYTEDFSRVSTTPDVLPDSPSGIVGKTKLTKITEGAVSFPDTGSGDHLTIADSTDLYFGGGQFSIESFIYKRDTGTFQHWFRQRDDGSDEQAFVFDIDSSGGSDVFKRGYVQLEWGADKVFEGTNADIGNDRWHHLLMTKDSGGTARIFVDGVLKGSQALGDPGDQSSAFYIGNYSTSNSYEYKGFMSNMRLVKGSIPTDYQTSSTTNGTKVFVPPTSPLTTTSQGATANDVKLLCCQSTTSATAAAVAPTSGVNDGTIWSEESTITYDGAADTTYSTGRVEAMFDGSSSTDFGVVNGTSNKFINIVFPSGISVSSSVKVYAAFRNGMVWSINGSTVTSSGVSHPNSGVQTLGFTSGTMNSLRCQVANGNALEISYIEVDGVILQNPVSSFGNASATNFNPFTDDINAIRGQASGYATLNPLKKTTNQTLSDGNLKCSQPSNVWGCAASTIVMYENTGKFYFECTIESTNYTYAGIANGDALIFNLSAVPSGRAYFGGTNNSWGLLSSSGNLVHNTSSILTSGAALSAGDTIGITFDTNNKESKWYVEGVLYYTLTLDGSYPFIFGSGSYLSSNTVNFGQKPFKFPPPDGFQPLNLSTVQPEKVIARPDQYVGVSLWSGNGTSQNITGLKHKPDFVWIKKRAGGSARSHQLFDTVRGVHKSLHSNSTNGEDTNTSRLTAFNQDGFTVGGDDGSNGSSGTFVGWTWKAGGNKNTFNIDDVGYANASDVGMNVGALNSSLYNTSRVWSSGIANSSSDFDQPATNAFNGNRSNKLRTGGNSVLVTLNFSPALTVTNNIQILGEDYSTANFRYTVTVDGTTTTKDVDQGQPATFNVSGSLTQITFDNNNSNGRTYLEWIKVDGKELIDSNVTINTPSIAPTGCSAGTKQGFSIIKYSHTVNSYQTIPHGLSQAPQFIIAKWLDGTTNWNVYHASASGAGGGAETGRFTLNNANSYTNEADVWGDTAPTDKVWTVGGSTWQGSGNHISYLWHDVPGLQKFGKYTANNSADGPYIELGFRPTLVVCKSVTQGQPWQVYDAARSSTNPTNRGLQLDSSGTEYNSTDRIDILSNGFKIRAGGGTEPNVGTNTYIYCAWAEAPTFNLYGAQANAR